MDLLRLAAQRANDDPAILYELAELYEEEYGATPEVFNLLERAVRLDREHAPAHFLLGELYLEQGRGQKAIEHYEQARAFTPSASMLGRKARRKLAYLRPPMPRQAQGWGETWRSMTGLMLSPVLAALINARFIPWDISLPAWGALAMAAAGAYLWTCAADAPHNPAMRALFGKRGAEGWRRKTLLGLPGVLLWAIAFGLILGKA